MKAYLITNKWDDGDTVKETICVIADTVNEAKSIAVKDECMCDSEYIDLRAKISKNANIKGLSKGVFENERELLIRNICTTMGYMDCPNCGTKETTVEYDILSGFSCDNCYGELGELNE